MYKYVQRKPVYQIEIVVPVEFHAGTDEIENGSCLPACRKDPEVMKTTLKLNLGHDEFITAVSISQNR